MSKKVNEGFHMVNPMFKAQESEQENSENPKPKIKKEESKD